MKNLYVPSQSRGIEKSRELMKELAKVEDGNKFAVFRKMFPNQTIVKFICKRCIEPPFEAPEGLLLLIDPNKHEEFTVEKKKLTQSGYNLATYITIVDGCQKCLIHGETVSDWMISCAKSLRTYPGTMAPKKYCDSNTLKKSYPNYYDLFEHIKRDLEMREKFDDFCRIFKEFCGQQKKLESKFEDILLHIKFVEMKKMENITVKQPISMHIPRGFFEENSTDKYLLFGNKF